MTPREVWRHRIEAWYESGLHAREFAEGKDFKASGLNYWCSRLGHKGGRTAHRALEIWEPRVAAWLQSGLAIEEYATEHRLEPRGLAFWSKRVGSWRVRAPSADDDVWRERVRAWKESGLSAEKFCERQRPVMGATSLWTKAREFGYRADRARPGDESLWKERVAAWAASGLSTSAFAADKDYSATRLRAWRRKLGVSAKDEQSPNAPREVWVGRLMDFYRSGLSVPEFAARNAINEESLKKWKWMFKLKRTPNASADIPDLWRTWVDRYRASGRSLGAFAAEHDLSTTVLEYWDGALRMEAEEAEERRTRDSEHALWAARVASLDQSGLSPEDFARGTSYSAVQLRQWKWRLAREAANRLPSAAPANTPPVSDAA